MIPPIDQLEEKNHSFLRGGGEMGRLTREFNWSDTILGDPSRWPQSLKSILNLLLNSKFPMFLFWGPKLICFYNDAFRPSLGNEGEHRVILGMTGETAMPEIWPVIKPLIDQVLFGVEATFSEDRLIPIYRNGKIEDVYWTFSYSPVSDESGQPNGVFVTCSETTAKVIALNISKESEERFQAMASSLKISEQTIEQMLVQLPAKVIFFRGPDLVVDTANDAVLETWNKTREAAIGKPLLEVLPELKGQPFPAELQHVFDSGNTITRKEVMATLNLPEGGIKSFYNDYFYQPLIDSEGNRIGVLATSFDVTDKVKARNKLEYNEAELQSANEKLSATNKELYKTQQSLEHLLDSVTESEAKFKNFVYQAPVAIAIFKGPEFIIDIYNEKVLEYWGRTAGEVAGIPLFKALPEASGQGFEELLTNVLQTGERFIANELPVTLSRNGVLETTWINFVYDPVRALDGKIEGIIVVCNEVTEQVSARRDLERAYEQSRLSKEAAQLGTFDMDLEKGTMEWDARCRILFGISHNDIVTYDKDFVTGLFPDDRERIIGIISNEVMVQSVSNGIYDVEYRTVGVEDQKVRWVRAKGQVYFDKEGIPKRFIGSVLDITEQKQDEQRKNDFIGMVSHELKTPLTSLTAIVQVMKGKLKDNPDAFLTSASEKANVQVKKMTAMINGFLSVSRLESGKIVIDKQPFELDGLINETIAEIMLTAPSHTITLEPSETVIVNADRDKISSVISNLLSNAVKYSPKGKLIAVKCEPKGNNVQVSVSDEGIGIKPVDLDKLFDRYYRIESKHTAHIAGFGIGLYLSAEIIQRHNGKIWAESGRSVGSTFYFSLPL